MIVGDNHNSHVYKVGLYLSIMYMFMGLIANGVLPYVFQRIALYSLLGYGAFVILMEMIHGRFIIPDFSIYYIILLLVCFITNLYSDRKELMPGNFYNMIICFFLTCIMSIFIRSKKDLTMFCWGNVIASIVMIFLLFVSGRLYGSRLERLGEDISGNANLFAMAIMYPCMFAIWLLIYGKYKRKVKFFLLFAILIDIYAIILSGGRKSFLLPFIFFYLLLLFKKDVYNKKHLIKYSILTLLIVFISIELLQSIPVFYETIGVRIERMLNEITGKGVVDNSTLIRAEFRKIGIEGWLNSPIWGNGFDSFKAYAREKTGYYVYSHCNQTELLFCGGIVLFFVYYGGYVFIYNKAQNPCLPNEYAAFAKAAIISEFIFDYGLVSYNIFYVQSFVLIAFIVVRFTNQEEKENKPKNQLSKYKYIIGE